MAATDASPADVKELIPEFFGAPNFLENVSGLPLTTTTEGRNVAPVNTAHWTHNAHDFVSKMGRFLQANNIIMRLPAWIDLIFGWKSRGQAAVDAKNLFHRLCYVRDDVGEQIESEDRIEREVAVNCVINFVQRCHQVFIGPHPMVLRRFARPHLMTDSNLIIPQRLNFASFPRFNHRHPPP
jgi:hypothetical protein